MKKKRARKPKAKPAKRVRTLRPRVGCEPYSDKSSGKGCR